MLRLPAPPRPGGDPSNDALQKRLLFIRDVAPEPRGCFACQFGRSSPEHVDSLGRARLDSSFLGCIVDIPVEIAGAPAPPDAPAIEVEAKRLLAKVQRNKKPGLPAGS